MCRPKRSRSPNEPPSAGSGDNGRAARIDAIAAEVARRLEAGEPVDDAAIEGEHADLMPELGERLRDVRMFMATAEQAKGEERHQRPTSPREKLLEEERRALREALERYEVLDRIEYGGQGVVYRARQRATKRIVALKVLLDGPLASERQRYRFEREVELISRLRHPNIVTVYDSGTVRERLFYAMEFVEGQTIGAYVILHDLTPPEIVRLVVKVARAINYAHQNGIIHRDLSPANILVDEHGEPRVFDFGLAKDTWASGDNGRYTVSGQAMGTLPYISPEQAGGFDGKIDVRSDIYTLAVVLYELLTDVFPYPVDDEPHVVRQAIISTEPLPLRKAIALSEPDRAPGLETINRDLETILAEALAKEKDERYQSTADFADDLERYLAGEAISARAHHALYVLRKTLRKYRWPAAFAAAMLVTLTIASIAVTASWLHARTQRDNAREATVIAFDLFGTALTDIEESVRPLAGGVAVRDRLIERVADKVAAFESVIQSDEALLPLQTQLLEKQGDIAYAEGRRADATKYYQAFLENSRELADAAVTDADAVNGVLRGYRKLGEVSEDPILLFERAIELGEQALGQRGNCPDTRFELCRLRLSLGERLQQAGHRERALEQFERTLALCRADEDSGRGDVRSARLAADALSNKGLILHWLGDAAASKRATERAMVLREQIVASNPADTEARFALLQSYNHLGTLARDGDRLEEAEEHLREAAAHGTLLGSMDPTAIIWHRDRYSVHHRLASLYLDRGTLAEAQVECQRALSIVDAWVARDDCAEAQAMRAYALMLQGRLQMEKRALGAAQEWFEQALSICESLVAQAPESPERAEQLATAHAWLASACRKLGDFAQALKYRQGAYLLHARIRELQPNGIESALHLIRAQVNLAVAHMDLGTPEDNATAERLLNDAEGVLTGLMARGALQGWERWCETRLRAIKANQRILDRRQGAGALQASPGPG